MKSLFCASLALLASTSAFAAGQIRITEWMYNGSGGEFVEFTNVGDAAVDMTGWSFDDNSQIPGVQPLSGFGVVQPGQSVILTEDPAATFAADWSLSGVVIVGDLTANLGANDQINLFDAGNVLVDRLTYGTNNVPGSIVTLGISGWTTLEHLGDDTALSWKFSVVGDEQNSFLSSNGDLGNPGSYAPWSDAVTTYGSGCAGSGGFTPKLALLGIPANGQTVTFSIEQGLGGSVAFVFFGTGPTSIPLAAPCTLNVAPVLPLSLTLPLSGVGPGAGEFAVSTTLASMTPGITVTMQTFVIDPQGPAGYTASAGVSVLFQ